jgi:4-hydroxy-tetrahydrodipicolinate synthase
MIELALAGRFAEAKAIWERLQPLEEAIFARPVRDYRARTKEALVIQGLLERATVREPLLPIGEADRARVREALLRAVEVEPVAVGS